MVKEKRILSYFIGWLVLGLIICFIGIKNTYAATTTTYENIGYLNDVTVLYSLADDPPYPLEIPRGGEYQLYNVEKIMVQIDNYTFSGGTTYNLELSLPISTLTNNIYSVIDENGNKCSIGTTDSSNSSYPNYSFNCTKETSHLTLNIYNTDGSDVLNAGIFRWNYIYLRKQLTTTDTSILENQTSQIIDQNQQIIQGQDEIKDTIKEELNSCRPSVNLAYDVNYSAGKDDWWTLVKLNATNIVQGKVYTASVYLTADSNTRAYWNDVSGIFNTQNINVSSGTNKYTFTFTAKKSASSIIILLSKYGTGDNVLITPSKLQIEEGNVATNYEEPNTEICTNKIDDTNDKLDGIQGALTDSSAPNTSGLENSAGWLPAGPLDSVLNLPLSLFNALTTNLNKTCNPINIPLPYVNKNITLPCINTLYNQIGITSFLSWIGVIVSGLMLYTYLLKLYKWIEDRISLNETHNVDSWGGL